MTDARVTIVIPVYDEGENIRVELERIADELRVPYRVRLVYDRDDDNTLAPARQAARERGIPLECVKNAFGRGALNAIKTGLQGADTPWVVVTMADLSDPPSVINDMVAVAERDGAAVVCASRYMPGGRHDGGPRLKGFLSRWAGLSLYYLGAMPVRDVTNSFKLYAKSLLERITLESRGGFEVGFEILVKAKGLGLVIREVPTVWTDRSFGRSRFRLFAWLPRYLKWYWRALIS